jgi:hypothetical protein
MIAFAIRALVMLAAGIAFTYAIAPNGKEP